MDLILVAGLAAVTNINERELDTEVPVPIDNCFERGD